MYDFIRLVLAEKFAAEEGVQGNRPSISVDDTGLEIIYQLRKCKNISRGSKRRIASSPSKFFQIIADGGKAVGKFSELLICRS
jgi:hypothetical protein